MEKCNLCREKEAIKKGSHIVPACVIETLFPRNKELVYTRSSNEEDGFNIGRDVIDEDVIAQIGRSITDEELSKNQLPMVRDYIFCDACEKRLGYLEGIYFNDIHAKIHSKKTLAQFEIFEGRAGLISLFWYSVLWRLSVANNMTFSLKSKDQEFLRSYIYSNLRSGVKELSSHLKTIKESCPIPLAVLFNSNNFNNLKFWIEGVNDKDGARTLYCNEYIVVLYPDGTKPDKSLANLGGESFKIRIVDDKSWKLFLDIAATNVAKKIKRKLS